MILQAWLVDVVTTVAQMIVLESLALGTALSIDIPNSSRLILLS